MVVGLHLPLSTVVASLEMFILHFVSEVSSSSHIGADLSLIPIHTVLTGKAISMLLIALESSCGLQTSVTLREFSTKMWRILWECPLSNPLWGQVVPGKLCEAKRLVCLSHYPSDCVGSSCLPEPVPRKWDCLCSLGKQCLVIVSLTLYFFLLGNFHQVQRVRKSFFRGVLNLCSMTDIVNPWVNLTHRSAFCLGSISDIWKIHIKIWISRFLLGKKNDLATLEPHFQMGKISWSCTVAPKRVCLL